MEKERINTVKFIIENDIRADGGIAVVGYVLLSIYFSDAHTTAQVGLGVVGDRGFSAVSLKMWQYGVACGWEYLRF